MLDRLPPQNLEAEQGVLGSILQQNETMHDVALILAVDDFYRDAHQVVYKAILGLYDAGKAIDGITLADELTRLGKLEDVGGIEAIADIQNSVPHAANASYYAEIVRQKSISRQLIEAANEMLQEGYSNNFTAEQLLETSERRIFQIADKDAGGETYDAAQAMREVIAAMDRRAYGEFAGISSGLSDLDDVTNGFRPENLIIVAGRPGMGKSALAMNIAEHNAVYHQIPVLFVSLEMSLVELGDRLAASVSGVDSYRIRRGIADESEMRRFRSATETISRAPLFIDVSAGRNVTQIAANARRYKARKGIKLMIVDLLNEIDGDDSRASRREQLASISRRLKSLTRELSIPIIAVAQLNRDPSNREGNRPRMSDLKETGEFEQNAHLVILLHRPEYYKPGDQRGQAVIIVDKNRNGPSGDVNVMFHKQLTRFECIVPMPECNGHAPY